MYSKYIDNSMDENQIFRSMDTILENIVEFSRWRTGDKIDIDPYTGNELSYQVVKKYDDIQNILIKGTNIIFNYITYSYETIISGQENNPISAERIKTTHGNIVVYSDGIRTQYLVDRARGGTALSILRKINNSDKNKIIEAQSFNFSEEFFIWLLSRFMDNNKTLDEENKLVINKITGFKGEGNRKEAILSGSGNEVMNLLSSISFLIEMDAMTEIEVRVNFGRETFELRYFSKNSQIDVLIENYTGMHMMLPDEDKIPRVLLESFINVVPGMMTSFNEDCANDDWTMNSKREFTLGLVDSIRIKLDTLYPPLGNNPL